MRRRGGGTPDGGARHTRLASPRRAHGPLGLLVAALASVALALSGCTATGATSGPRFVTPPLIRFSSVLWPVPLELVGAAPGSRVRIEARLRTSRGSWHSAATYTVPATGVVDLASATPQLAAFRRPDSAGLFWSLRGPQLPPAQLARQWMRDTNAVTLTASDGDRLVAERTFELQGLAAEQSPHTVYTRDLLAGSFEGLLPRETHEEQPVGRFWDASSLERPVSPAVLMFDDPSTGASSAFTAPLLSAFGASVFVLPLGSPDGVHVSSVIDSGTVESVLQWLSTRQDVDGRHIFVYGTGPAEPLALWAAARFPDRLHGVFAGGGAASPLCSPPGARSPIDEGGVPVACVNEATARATSLAGMNGPVVLVCGGRDAVLESSCEAQRAVAALRTPRAGDALLVQPDAAHAVTVPPGLPIALPDASGARGADAQATQEARVAFWNTVGHLLLRAALP
ncbi:acyl-CoA thioesterase/BAAT N-terminal domain-containing protein [Leifsonia sp. NPDC080035]|uniref:Acyl-CoA thioesterase/BAAT N-terminal domain-containing protein n=1 Tax=Leifsonia sp. NPDC080035 TaxID=3143936 RepID=A0AAU7G7R5_9MICO